MITFLARRVASAFVLVAAVSTMTYLLLYLGSGDIARNILGTTASSDLVEAKKAELGLDRPLLSRFTDWAGGAVQGDLGASWFSGQPVWDALLTRLPVTLSIVLGATIVTAIVSVVLGVAAARRGGAVDQLVQIVSLLGLAVPGFLVALGLVTLVAINLGWVAPTGYVEFGTSPVEWLKSIILPILALAVGGVAGVAAQVRTAMLEAMSQDYIRTLRSRGLPERRVLYRHALRNAAGPATSVLAVQFVGLLGGAVLVEQIFAIPGLGQIAVVATSQGDIPLVMGLVVATTILVVVVNAVLDVVQGFLNPKVRVG